MCMRYIGVISLFYDICLGLVETSKALMGAKLLEVWLVSAMQSLYGDAADLPWEESKEKLLCSVCYLVKAIWQGSLPAF